MGNLNSITQLPITSPQHTIFPIYKYTNIQIPPINQHRKQTLIPYYQPKPKPVRMYVTNAR